MQIVRNINDKPAVSDKLVVLLAEDHPLTAKIEGKSLEDGGFRVQIAQNFEELIKHIEHHKVDVLMIDSLFDKKDIINSLYKIRNVSLNSSLKIIVTGILKSQKSIRNPNQNKYDLFVLKPIQHSKLIDEIKQLFMMSARKSDRIPVELISRICFDNKSIEGKVIDIGKHGIHFQECTQKIKKHLGTTVKLEIDLPRYKKPVILTGILIRKTKEGFGIKSLNISKESKEKLDKFLAKNGRGIHLETYYL